MSESGPSASSHADQGIRIVYESSGASDSERPQQRQVVPTGALSLEIDIRSQRVSDIYPIRQRIFDRTNNLALRLYRKSVAAYLLEPIISLLFPRVLNNAGLISYFFHQTTQVKLLCEWTCAEGHICSLDEGHRGKHVCVFGHAQDAPILKCPHLCDCRSCDAECVFPVGHSGIHKCYFKHSWSDIPSSRAQQRAFRDDKAIGEYIDELAYCSTEEMKFSHIPECLDPEDERVFNSHTQS